MCLRLCFDAIFASTVLVLKRLTSFTGGADSGRLTDAISADWCAEIKSAFATAYAEFGGRGRESEARSVLVSKSQAPTLACATGHANVGAKLQSRVYHILPPTTAIIDCTIGLGKPSAKGQVFVIIIIIIMYIYHALINALSAHMIHINLNMIFYTHVKHSPTKTNYIKYY